MTLSRRVSVFFLSALAIVLIGFAAALFVLARAYMLRQADARLNAALTTLWACAEVDEDGIEWEPNQRPIAVGLSSDPSEPRWMVQDEKGRVIDRSRNLATLDRSPEVFEARPWKVATRRLVDVHHRRHHHKHRELLFTAAVGLGPIWSALGLLALALTGLSVTIWTLAAVVGSRICGVALRPLSRMADSARSMKADDLDRRLPVSKTGDELEDLGQSFNGLLDRLQETFERQRRFSGDASHQLRTPLTALIGQIDVVLRRERSNAEYRDVLNLARDQAAQMTRIVEALLFLARADADAPLPGVEPVDLIDWIPRHLEHYGMDQVDAREIVWERGEVDSVSVLAHPPLLAQLLDNLLDNAYKYSPRGTPIVIRTRSETRDGVLFAALDVEDRGPGIAQEDVDRIFEPFYRSERVRLQGRAGVGLGLAVASRIARAFGGFLTAVPVSNPKGTRFTLLLPRFNPTLTNPDSLLDCSREESPVFALSSSRPETSNESN